MTGNKNLRTDIHYHTREAGSFDCQCFIWGRWDRWTYFSFFSKGFSAPPSKWKISLSHSVTRGRREGGGGGRREGGGRGGGCLSTSPCGNRKNSRRRRSPGIRSSGADTRLYFQHWRRWLSTFWPFQRHLQSLSACFFFQIEMNFMKWRLLLTKTIYGSFYVFEILFFTIVRVYWRCWSHKWIWDDTTIRSHTKNIDNTYQVATIFWDKIPIDAVLHIWGWC